MNLIPKVKKTILQNHLVESGDHVLVGVSGGPDSMALLNILTELRYELGIELSVAHLNHNLRKDSARDEKFVRAFAAKMNLKYISASARIQKAKGRSSLEEAAREARFEFLVKSAKEMKANKIALAHTKDDLAETVLMRILRGTGLEGLRSILPKREMKGMTFIRPLLGVEKKELLVFLKKKKISFCVDSTNKDVDFFRNKIRLKLLPLLEKEYQPNIREVLAHLAQVSAVDYDFLAKKKKEVLKKTFKASTNPKAVCLDTRVLGEQHPSLQRFLIREMFTLLKSNEYSFSLNHTKDIQNLLQEKEGTRCLLPQGISVTRKADHIEFCRE